MKKLTTLLFVCTTLFLSAQPIAIDVHVNKQDNNTEYSASKLLKQYVDEATWECVTLNFIDSFDAGTSPYVLEMWEEEEFLRNFVFKETKTKKDKNRKGEEIEKKFTVAGVRVRTKIQYFGRLSERESNVILEIFNVDGDIDKDIEDEDVKAKYKKLWIDNRELNDAMIEKHAEKIAKLRVKTSKELKSLLGFAMLGAINKRLLGPVKLTDIVEKDKDKVKKMNFSHCAEIPVKGDGVFNMTCYSEEELNGVRYIMNQGGVYLAKKDEKEVFNVRGGKKEILRAFEEDKAIYVGYKDYMFNEDLSSAKSEDARKVTFNFFYAAMFPFSDLDKTKFQLFFQARYLGYRNLKVLRTDFIKNRGADILTEGGTDLVYVIIGDFKTSKLSKSATDRVAGVEVSTYNDKKKVEEKSWITGYKDSKDTWQTNYDHLVMGAIDEAILKNDVEIIGIIEQKDKEVKKVLIRTTLPVDKSKFKIYDKKRVTKKTKELAKIKVKDITGRYTAIAEVTDGKKELLPKLKSNATLTIKHEGGGIFSLGSSDGFRDLGGIRRYHQ